MTVNLFSCFTLQNYYNIRKLLNNYLLIISSFVKHYWFTNRNSTIKMKSIIIIINIANLLHYYIINIANLYVT